MLEHLTDIDKQYIATLLENMDYDLMIDPDSGDFFWRDDTEFENLGRLQELINLGLNRSSVDITDYKSDRGPLT